MESEEGEKGEGSSQGAEGEDIALGGDHEKEIEGLSRADKGVGRGPGRTGAGERTWRGKL